MYSLDEVRNVDPEIAQAIVDEQNRQNDIKRQQAREDASKYSSDSSHFSSDAKNVGIRYDKLKKAVESYYVILVKAAKLDKILNIDNYNQTVLRSVCLEYINNFSVIAVTSPIFDKGHHEEYSNCVRADHKIVHFGEIIDKGLEVAEKASKLGKENIEMLKDIYLICMSTEKHKEFYDFTSPDEYRFEDALTYKKQDNN